MKTYWLNGEIIPEKLNHTEEKVELNEQEKVNHVTIDEGIDETFSLFHQFYYDRVVYSKHHSPVDMRDHSYKESQSCKASGPCACIQSHPTITQWTPPLLASSQITCLTPNYLKLFFFF